jgi:hypothetical protein
MRIQNPMELPTNVLLNQLSLAPSSNNDSVLIVQNHSSLPQQFVLFASNPEFTSGQYPDQIFTSVYQASLKVAPSSGTVTFVVADCEPAATEESNRRVYVVTGRARKKLGKGVILYNNDTTLLKLATKDSSRQACCTVTIPSDWEPSFAKADTASRPLPKLDEGEIQIQVDTSFSYPSDGRWSLLMIKPP